MKTTYQLLCFLVLFIIIGVNAKWSMEEKQGNAAASIGRAITKDNDTLRVLKNDDFQPGEFAIAVCNKVDGIIDSVWTLHFPTGNRMEDTTITYPSEKSPLDVTAPGETIVFKRTVKILN